MIEELGKGHSTGLSPGGGAIGCWTGQKLAALPSPTAPKTALPPLSVIISELSLLKLFLPFYSNIIEQDISKYILTCMTKICVMLQKNIIILHILSSKGIPFGRTPYMKLIGGKWWDWGGRSEEEILRHRFYLYIQVYIIVKEKRSVIMIGSSQTVKGWEQKFWI